MSSPVFSESTFKKQEAVLQQGFTGDTMTLKGAVNKSLLLFLTMVGPAALVWWLLATGSSPVLNTYLLPVLIASLIGGLIIALIISFRMKSAPYLAPVYAALEGVLMGTISYFFELKFPGIVMQATTITLLIFGGMLMAYRTGLLRATPMFTKVIVYATMGVALFYLINFICILCGVNSFYSGSSWLSIIISIVVAGVASFNLILDFDLIDSQSRIGAPKYMEWYCAFGLLVTVIWIYIEILRLLSKLSSRD